MCWSQKSKFNPVNGIDLFYVVKESRIFHKFCLVLLFTVFFYFGIYEHLIYDFTILRILEF